MTRIVWLQDPAAGSAEVGGKGASLVDLIRGGFPVPDGFVITADGYRRFISANDLQPLIEQVLAAPSLRTPKEARAVAQPLFERVLEAALPPDLEQEASDAYARLLARGAAVVAVRSSALSEDASSASSAGLYETYLNLKDREAVLDAVRRCYASLWSARAVQYRAFKGLDSRNEAMPVVIMTQVPSEAAGVAFTINPVTGNRDQIVVNGSWGLGESVVSGRVTPDNFILDKRTLQVVGRDISEKEIEIVADPDGGSGVAVRSVERSRVAVPSLTDADLLTLGQVCCAIESRYGRPMDVEWAFAGGSLAILQARPVTALG
jgi:phosphoenolpyruvate synthase/pyruvate phosphate dikinase